MYRFLVVIEKINNNYSAYSPDLPGCVSTGATREEAEMNMYEAIWKVSIHREQKKLKKAQYIVNTHLSF